MSDARLRSLERAAQHDPDAAAQWLRERMRCGTIERRNIELAATLGHGPACSVLGMPVLVERNRLTRWSNLLFAWPHHVPWRRALVAVAKHWFHRMDGLPAEVRNRLFNFEEDEPRFRPRVEQAINIACEWIEAPNDADRQRFRACTYGLPSPWPLVACWLAMLDDLHHVRRPEEPFNGALRIYGVEAAEETITGVMRDAVVPWALR